MLPTNALSIDVEDYFHVSGFERDIPREHWDRFHVRLVDNTRRLLDILARHQVRATFFVLGWVAQRFPYLVREIHGRGHEVGSHSFWHRLVYEQAPEDFRQDLRRSRDVLQQLLGVPVNAYRAPSFSVTRQSLWALDILVEEGFVVDSSVFPVRHDRYGISSAPRQLHKVVTSAGEIWEFPPAVSTFGPVRIPVSGGGYFRLLPFGMTCRLLQRINTHAGQPFIFYLHPWEIDPDQPRLGLGSRLSRFRHNVNLASTESKLAALLATFRFAPVGEVISSYEGRRREPASPCHVYAEQPT